MKLNGGRGREIQPFAARGASPYGSDYPFLCAGLTRASWLGWTGITHLIEMAGTSGAKTALRACCPAKTGPEKMRIVDIRETAVPLNSTLANSSIDFSEMTTSVVAVITDVKRSGKPVCRFAFNSTGRYACGAQR